MKSYSDEVHRRIEQFNKILVAMHRRAHKEIQGPCFLIFGEDDPCGGECPAKSAAAVMADELILAVFADSGVASIPCERSESDFCLSTEGWGGSDAMSRYVQFAFEEKWFCLDMPLQTLYREEAETLLRSRLGSFFLQDRPEFTLKDEDVDGFDPFRKVYGYGDERSAAEDMAYIWFQLWRLPIDSCLYVTAHPFNGQRVNWERGKRLS